MSERPFPPAWRRELRSFGELFALNGFAVAQPLLDIFGRAPDQFIFRGAQRADIIWFGLILLLAGPILGYGVERVAGLINERIRKPLHMTMLGGLTVVFIVNVLGDSLHRLGAIALGVVAAAALVFLYLRTRGPRIWLAFASPAPVIFLVIFLFASQVTPLMSGESVDLGESVDQPDPTVVIFFDELPLPSLLDTDGDIDEDLFPNFARLADTSHWFRETTAVANYTWLAAPSMLTGKLPADGTTPVSTDHPDNLFTLVGASMPLTSSELITSLCPAAICERLTDDQSPLPRLLKDAAKVMRQRLSPGAEPEDPVAGMTEDLARPVDAEGIGEIGDPSGGSDRFGRFLERVGTADEGLDFIHLLLPHIPWRYLPDGTEYAWPSPDFGRFFDGWVNDDALIELARQRHLLQTMWTDAVLGQVMDRLEEQGRFDETNLVVVADHGVGFMPGGPNRGKNLDVEPDDVSLTELTRVPFFVKTVGQTEGRVSEDPVRNIDLTPTVAELLGAEITWEHDARSAFAGGSGDPDEIEMWFADHLDSGDVDVGPRRTIDRERSGEIALERAAGVFAPAEDDITGADRIFRVGPDPDLWGEPVPEDLEEIPIDVHDPAMADDVDLDSGLVPALFSADVDESLEEGEPVAVSVNGTVWATTHVATMDGDRSVAAILPREAFEDGSNDLAVHLLESADD